MPITTTAKTILALGTLFFLMTTGSHAQQSRFDEKILKGKELHDRGADGDKQAVKDAIVYFENLLEQEPNNELARVYLGSSYTIRSRDVGIGPGKLDTLKKGGRIMDQAVANAPNDIRVRLVRGVNYLRLPALFGKRDEGRADLLAILDAVQNQSGPQIDSLSAGEKQAIYYFGALALHQTGKKREAQQVFQKALEFDPDSELAPDIRKELR